MKPEIVLAAAANDSAGRKEAQPDISRLQVGGKSLGIVTLEICRIQAIWIDFVLHCQTFPKIEIPYK